MAASRMDQTAVATRNSQPTIRRLSNPDQSEFDRAPTIHVLVAPHDIDRVSFAAMPGNRYGFRAAARHIGAVRRRDSRWISMGPIPWNIIRIGVVGIARRGLRPIQNGFAVIWLVEEARSGPEATRIVSPDMPERSASEGSMGNRMRRGRPAVRGSSRPGECRVRGKQKR